MTPARKIPVVIYQEGEYWLAQAFGVGVATFGETLAEAKMAIQEALELYFEDEDELTPVCPVLVETVVV